MSRIETILANSRDLLGDNSNSPRWSDPILLRFLNEGLKDFIRSTKILRKKTYIKLEQNIAIYDLSQSVLSIDRIQYNGKALSVKSEEEMDKISLLWEDTVALEPAYTIFSNLKAGVFRIWPKVVEGSANIVTQNQAYGGLIDIEVTDELFSLPEIENVESDIYKYVSVIYNAKPILLTLDSLDSDIEIDEMHDIALQYYITGQALRVDQDTANRQFSAEQLALYSAYVDKTKTEQSVNNNTFSRQTIPYRGFQ